MEIPKFDEYIKDEPRAFYYKEKDALRYAGLLAGGAELMIDFNEKRAELRARKAPPITVSYVWAVMAYRGGFVEEHVCNFDTRQHYFYATKYETSYLKAQ